MNEEFVELLDQAAELVRKRSLRQLGASPFSQKIVPLIQKRLSSPIQDCSAVIIGDAIVEIFIWAIESLKPEQDMGDSPARRQYTYLYEYLVAGKEWKNISDEMHVSRSTYYDVRSNALETLATVIWRRKLEAEMTRKILHNLSRASFTTFTEVYDESGKQYVEEVIIPTLRTYRGWTITLVGEPGVGKSSIAREVAERLVKNPNKYNLPFEAVIWMSFRRDQFEPEANKRLVVSVLDSMSQVYEEIGKTLENLKVLQNSVEDKRAIVEKLLKERACLIIADNLDSEWTSPEFLQELEAFIRGLPKPHMSLVTMRPEKPMWEGTFQIKVNPMRKDVAEKFLAEVAVDRGVRAFTPSEFERVYEKTHGVPIATKLVLGLTRMGGYSLEEALDFGDYSRMVLEHMFEKAYERLPLHARKILLAMRLFGDRVSAEALEYASAVTGPERVDAISRLYRGYMIEKTVRNGSQEAGFTILPFFREYLQKRMTREDENVDERVGPNFLSEASDRVAEYYKNLLIVGKDRRENGLLLLKSEKQNILNAMTWSLERKNINFVEILELIGPQMGTLRFVDDRIAWGKNAAAFLAEQGQPRESSWFRIRDVAWSLFSKGTPESRKEGHDILAEEYALAVKNDWPANKALAMRNLAKFYIEDGKFEEAEAFLQESMEIWEKTGEAYWKTVTLHRIADLKDKQKLYMEAIEIYETVEKEYQRIGYNDAKIEVMSSRASTMAKSDQCEKGLQLINGAIIEARQIHPPAYAFAFAMRIRSEIKELCNEIQAALGDAKLSRDTYDALGINYNVHQMDDWIEALRSRETPPSSSFT